MIQNFQLPNKHADTLLLDLAPYGSILRKQKNATDWGTNQRTDKAYHRDARTHLKHALTGTSYTTFCLFWSDDNSSFAFYRSDDNLRAELVLKTTRGSVVHHRHVLLFLYCTFYNTCVSFAKWVTYCMISPYKTCVSFALCTSDSSLARWKVLGQNLRIATRFTRGPTAFNGDVLITV